MLCIQSLVERLWQVPPQSGGLVVIAVLLAFMGVCSRPPFVLPLPPYRWNCTSIWTEPSSLKPSYTTAAFTVLPEALHRC